MKLALVDHGYAHDRGRAPAFFSARQALSEAHGFDDAVRFDADVALERMSRSHMAEFDKAFKRIHFPLLPEYDAKAVPGAGNGGRKLKTFEFNCFSITDPRSTHQQLKLLSQL